LQCHSQGPSDSGPGPTAAAFADEVRRQSRMVNEDTFRHLTALLDLTVDEALSNMERERRAADMSEAIASADISGPMVSRLLGLPARS